MAGSPTGEEKVSLRAEEEKAFVPTARKLEKLRSLHASSGEDDFARSSLRERGLSLAGSSRLRCSITGV